MIRGILIPQTYEKIKCNWSQAATTPTQSTECKKLVLFGYEHLIPGQQTYSKQHSTDIATRMVKHYVKKKNWQINIQFTNVLRCSIQALFAA